MDNSEVIIKMKSILADKLDVPVGKITPQALLKEDLGMDSFGAVEILFEIEDAFNVDVPQDNVVNIKTFGDMVGFIEKLRAQGTVNRVCARKDNNVA